MRIELQPLRELPFTTAVTRSISWREYPVYGSISVCCQSSIYDDDGRRVSQADEFAHLDQSNAGFTCVACSNRAANFLSLHKIRTKPLVPRLFCGIKTIQNLEHPLLSTSLRSKKSNFLTPT